MSIEIGGKKYYSTQEVAEMFEVSAASVRVWLSEGKIEAYKFGPNNFFSDEQITAFEASQKKREEIAGKRGPKGPRYIRKRKPDNQGDSHTGSSVQPATESSSCLVA